MKSFKNFLNEEAKLKGSAGVPEEKLKEIERQAEREKGIRIDDPSQIRTVGGAMMRLIDRSRSLMFDGKTPAQCREVENKLVKLATDVIMIEYGDILQNVDLQIKLVPFGAVGNELPEIKEIEARPSQSKQKQKAEELDEPKEEAKDKKKSFLDNLLAEAPKKKEDWLKSSEYKYKVDVAKLINAIGQGEAKNTKNILHSEEVKSGLKDIFGDKSGEIFKVWDELSKVADKMDWIIPIEMKASMMSDSPEGMAGAVKVKWTKEENEEDLSDDAEDILKNIEEGEDIDDNKEEIAELLSTGNPKIKAVGVDFPMLLHETVKGIYQLIGSAWIPSKTDPEEEKKKAEIVKAATTSFEDEAEEFRYGPYLAAALRDFVNSCPGVDRYPNIREFVWGDMCYMARNNPKGFLDLFRGILEKTPTAKSTITSMIDDIIDRIKEYEIEEIGTQPSIEKEVEREVEAEMDYTKLNRKQLDDELNLALDRGDKLALDLISKELSRRNESVMLDIYGKDINMILKS